jgi:hypothetical protein
MALSMDPLMWAAYEELCILGMYDDIHLISCAHWAYLMKYDHELIGDDLVFSFWSCFLGYKVVVCILLSTLGFD